jgi:cytoskeletal protein RodZ
LQVAVPPSEARNETRTQAGESPAATPGAFLRQARERRGVSLRQIAATTKISVMTLDALERGDVPRLPGGIFTRAFIRSYAREVGFDPDQAVRDYLAQCPAAAENEDQSGGPHAAEPFETDAPRAGVGRAWRFVGVVLPVALVVAYFWFSGRPVPSDRPTPLPAAPAVVEPAPPAEASDAGAAGAAADPAAGANVAVAAPSSPDSPVAGPAGVPTTAEDKLEARLVLRLSPTEECWVWWRADGGEAQQQLMRAGEAREIRARDEVLFTLGNAGAMVFSLNGQPGRSLGGPGAVVKDVRITPQNYRSFLSGPQAP